MDVLYGIKGSFNNAHFFAKSFSEETRIAIRGTRLHLLLSSIIFEARRAVEHVFSPSAVILLNL